MVIDSSLCASYFHDQHFALDVDSNSDLEDDVVTSPLPVQSLSPQVTQPDSPQIFHPTESRVLDPQQPDSIIAASNDSAKIPFDSSLDHQPDQPTSLSYASIEAQAALQLPVPL